jgi:hypothetical protein
MATQSQVCGSKHESLVVAHMQTPPTQFDVRKHTLPQKVDSCLGHCLSWLVAGPLLGGGLPIAQATVPRHGRRCRPYV